MNDMYVRAFPLEDIRIRSGGDGRTVEAYAAVFDVPAKVRDQDGVYEEVIDRAAFNKALRDAAPAGSRANWRVGVFYNHGMTLWRTPSERASMPIGLPLEIRADRRGLLTVTRYHRTELAEEVLESIREGSISGYSFTGNFLRSTPIVPRGGFRPDRSGKLTTVRRLESTLKEFGPTPFPAYAEAAVMGVRSQGCMHDLGAAEKLPNHPEHPGEGPHGHAAPPPGAATEEPHGNRDVHSARSAVAWARTRADIRSRIGVHRG